jgi:catabolite regulation protein CreA
VIQSSNIPALVVDQYGTGDALQVMDGGVTKFAVDSSGITTLSGGVISNSGDGTINRFLLSEIPASNMYLQLYKTGNRTSNTGPSIIFGGSYYPTSDFPNAYAAIKGVATPYVSSSTPTYSGMLKFYVNDETAGGASLAEADCRMVIDNYGNVGIGTTNPIGKLQVNGDIIGNSYKGSTTGTAPSTGYIGEYTSITFTGVTNGTSTAITDISGASITLQPGIYLFYAEGSVGLTAPDTGRYNLSVFLTNSDNTVIKGITAHDIQSVACSIEQAGRSLFNQVLNITTARTLKLRYGVGASTSPGTVRNGTISAVRIA